MTSTRPLIALVIASLALLTAFAPDAAQAGPERAAIAVSDSRTPEPMVRAAAVGTRCRRGYKLRRATGGYGYICKRGRARRKPSCRAGYVRYRGGRRGRRGYICKRESHPGNPQPPQPGGQPPQPGAPANANPSPQQLIDKAVEFGRSVGDTYLAAPMIVYSRTRYYYWSIPAGACSLTDDITARCTLYIYQESTSGPNGAFERTIWRKAVFAKYIESLGRYTKSVYSIDQGTPYGYVCSNAGYQGVPFCG